MAIVQAVKSSRCGVDWTFESCRRIETEREGLEIQCMALTYAHRVVYWVKCRCPSNDLRARNVRISGRLLLDLRFTILILNILFQGIYLILLNLLKFVVFHCLIFALFTIA